jgi:hypothetical protein
MWRRRAHTPGGGATDAPHNSRAHHVAAVVDRLLAEARPLDEQQQQQVIAALEAQQLASERLFAALFAALALAGAAFFGHAAASQALHPWEARYTGELRPVTSVHSTAGVLALQGVALALAGAALLAQRRAAGARSPQRIEQQQQRQQQQQQRQQPHQTVRAPPHVLLAAAAALAGVGAVYWGLAMQRTMAKYGPRLGAHWELLWLPLGPLVYCGVCGYCLHCFSGMRAELQQLRRLAYDLKTA